MLTGFHTGFFSRGTFVCGKVAHASSPNIASVQDNE